MPMPDVLASRLYIQVNGADLKKQVMGQLTEAVVDQHTHLSGMFTLRLYDPDLNLVDGGPFDLAAKVKIEAARADGQKFLLIEGEVTALEPSFGDGKVAELQVRGYAASHRLFRQTKSKAYCNRRDSDLAEEIARENDLAAQVDPTPTIYEHVYQPNQSDLTFLMERAWRIGYECFVAGGTLYFRKPPAGPASLTLTWGADLLSFYPRMTLAEQVDEVVVKGWDVERQTAIVGRAQQGRLYPRIGEPKDGASWAHTFGSGRQVIVDQPVISQAEADCLAAARLDEISGAFVEAEGEAFRRPDLQAGRLVRLEALGRRFTGDYLVTRAIHRYNAHGLKTVFMVRGTRTGLLAEQVARRLPVERWSGVTPAVVTNADDPRHWGRVKVKFPWLSEDTESDWARVLGAGAGPQSGLAALPAVGDEVLVAFEHGDFGRPFVLGGLWNGKNGLPPEVSQAAQGKKPLVRAWRSRSGHSIVIYDDDQQKVEVLSAGGHRIMLDDQNQEVVITSQGGMKIRVNQDISIEGQANLSLHAASNLSLEANSSLTLKAANISIESTAATQVKGSPILLN